MSEGTGRAQLARAAVDSIGHQICDIVDVIEERSMPLQVFRADGGATNSTLVVQTQADLLGRNVEASDVPEVSALGVAKLAWQTLGHGQWTGRFQPRHSLWNVRNDLIGKHHAEVVIRNEREHAAALSR